MSRDDRRDELADDRALPPEERIARGNARALLALAERRAPLPVHLALLSEYAAAERLEALGLGSYKRDLPRTFTA